MGLPVVHDVLAVTVFLRNMAATVKLRPARAVLAVVAVVAAVKTTRSAIAVIATIALKALVLATRAGIAAIPAHRSALLPARWLITLAGPAVTLRE